MKKSMFIMLSAALLLTMACSNERERVRGANDFAIEGHVSGAADKTVILQRVWPTEVTTVDSMRIGDDGRFAFYGARPQSPEIYRLSIDNRYIYLSVDSTETVTVDASYAKLGDYTVKGSDNCLRLKELNALHAALQQQVQQIERSETLFPGQVRDSVLRVVAAYKRQVSEQFLLTGPDKAYAYYALFQTIEHVNGQKTLIYSVQDTGDLWAFGSVATSWSVFYPESERTKQLEEMTVNARQQMRRRQQPIDEGLISEVSLLDVSLPDANDQTRRLTDLKGQVVVLNFNDFHAVESGAIILALRELYAKYHDRGLEIYQVGVAQDAHWWRQSVDQLPWVSVLDQSGASARTYNVQGLGEFFIIDRNNTLQERVGIDGLEQAVEKYL